MEWLNENQGLIMVMLTAIYAFTTIWILIANSKTVNEARKTREEENRPYIIVFFEHKANGIVNLVIKNTGKTLANDVSFDFDIPLPYPRSHPLKDSNLIKAGIPSMPPQYEIKAMVEMMNQFDKDSEGKYIKHTVEVIYFESSGSRKYKETFILDPNIQSMLLGMREFEMHDLVKSVNQLVKQNR